MSRFEDEIEELVVPEAERLHGAKAVTYEVTSVVKAPGGSCSCCGANPRVAAADDYCLIFRAGICDEDGVFYSSLCDYPDSSGCLTAIRKENADRPRNPRDEMADVIREVNGDDVDGMESDMSGFEFLGDL